MDIIKELQGIIDRFNHGGIEYALCGGLAMAVYALPRATLDIDLMIQADSLDRAIRVLEPDGFVPGGPTMKFRKGQVRIARLRKIAPGDVEVLILDLLLVTEATAEAWRSRQSLEWEGRNLKVVSPEGMILLKELRRSGTDRDDIEHLRSIRDED